ncbi:uncharacterized protein LOC136025398 isoform X4 [Artemia franciscana]|uniref:F-box domain-containing protein n=2 Tax=Artemia franciscana TaxID=6661 RepID=A0AA88HRD7_ARTSF|nr:hypothetical protein QYM36_011248 [Artemia franciscana]
MDLRLPNSLKSVRGITAMDNLPNEILQKIFSFLSGPSLFYAGMVSARWRSIIYEFYLKESAMINWKAIALEFMDPNILSELIQEYSVTSFYMITGEKEEPVTSYGKLVSNAIWRKNLNSYEPRQTSFLGDEDIGKHINITEISIIVNSGDILLTHCHDKESLTMNTLTGKILKKTNQKNITHIELVNLYSRQVDICGGIYSKHDHFFLLVRNGLIKFMRMKDFATIGLIELYHGLQLKNICYDKPFLYVYDGHYGVTGFSVPSLQRCKRESVDGLDSFKVTNGTLCYIEDSGKYYSAEKQVKFSYTLQPFSINMVHYITAVCEKSPLNLEEEHFNSKIFRTDCVCLSVRGEYYLTMDGENYRSLNVIKSEYGTIKDVCVNGPTVAIGLHTGKVLVHYVPSQQILMSLDFLRPEIYLGVFDRRPVKMLSLFDNPSHFLVLASDGFEVAINIFLKD